MRFRTRAFLLCFVPFALLLTGSFWAIQKLVKSTVRDGLRTSLRQNHLAIARLRSRSDLRNSRFLKVAGENASLKAGLQLLASFPADSEARQTVEDQLQELCQQMGFDFLMVSDSNGAALAGVLRGDDQLTPLEAPLPRSPRQGLRTLVDKVYRSPRSRSIREKRTSASCRLANAFDFSGFSTPGVLMRNGGVSQSSLPDIASPEIEAALKECRGQGECDVRLGGAEYISLPMESGSLGDGYVLRSLQNVDSASGPVQSVLNRVFLLAATGMVFTALMCSVFSSRTMVRPITAMISHLRNSEGTGLLAEFRGEQSSIREIRDLTASFNDAASAIREGAPKPAVRVRGICGIAGERTGRP